MFLILLPTLFEAPDDPRYFVKNVISYGQTDQLYRPINYILVIRGMKCRIIDEGASDMSSRKGHSEVPLLEFIRLHDLTFDY